MLIIKTDSRLIVYTIGRMTNLWLLGLIAGILHRFCVPVISRPTFEQNLNIVTVQGAAAKAEIEVKAEAGSPD
jgi:hypothetical protein